MDPKETLKLFLQALIDREPHKMREHADDLAFWIVKGGFVPAAAARALEAVETSD